MEFLDKLDKAINAILFEHYDKLYDNAKEIFLRFKSKAKVEVAICNGVICRSSKNL